MFRNYFVAILVVNVLTDPRQLFFLQHIDNWAAADGCFAQDHTGRRIRDLFNDRGMTAKLDDSWGLEKTVSYISRPVRGSTSAMILSSAIPCPPDKGTHKADALI